MDHDFLIIGAGPAGLQIGFFLQKAGCDYAILEGRDRAGEFFVEFPRHRKLLSINKVYTGYDDRQSQLRYDWNSLLCDDDEMNFTKYTKEYYPDSHDYARYLRDYAKQFELNIEYGCQIANVARA